MTRTFPRMGFALAPNMRDTNARAAQTMKTQGVTRTVTRCPICGETVPLASLDTHLEAHT